MSFTVRPTRPEDAFAVAILREIVAAEDRWIGEADPAERDAMVDRIRRALGDPAQRWLVAKADRQVVGSISLRVDAGVAGLGMFVAADRRGQGIGRALLEEGVRWARRTGCHKVVLEVWPHNEPARRLYLAAGFIEEGCRRRHHRRRDGSLWDSIEMGLVLDETSPGCRWEPTATG